MEEDLEDRLMKRRLRSIVLAVISISLSLFPILSARSETDPESELNRVIENIKQREKTLRTFSAKFAQVKQTYLLHEPLHSEGLVYFDASGKMLWKVTSPSPMEVLLRDNLLFLYYPDLAKVEEKRLGTSDNLFKKYFGIGQPIEVLKEQYDIQLIPETRSGNYHLKLTPKQKAMAKHIDSIEVLVNSEDWLPEQIHFKEVKGDHTSLWLQFTSVNTPLPPGIFSIGYPQVDKDDLHRD